MQVNMNRHALTVLAYLVATFATQAVSHFGVNAGHYAEVPFLRPEPIFPLGVASMLIQGAALSVLFAGRASERRTGRDALGFAWLAGSVLVSYIALAEAAKYGVPSAGRWISVEIAAGFAQFTVFGALLGLIHRPRAAARR
jgi:hypothetical protein